MTGVAKLYHIYVAVSDTASVSLNPRKSQSTEKYTIKPQKGPVLSVEYTK